jgi:hypothetical protein
MRDDPEFIRWQDGYRYDPADRSSWWRSWLDVVVETPAGVSSCVACALCASR